VAAEIHEEHVLQVITDNYVFYVNAVVRLMDTRNIFIGLLALLIALT